MGDQQVGARFDRLIDRGGDGIDGEAHPPHAGARIAADQARGIPGFCAREGPQPIDRGEDLCEGGRHPTSLLPGRNGLVADVVGGPCRARTDDIHGVNVALYQLS